MSFWTIFVTLVLTLAVLLMTTFQVAEIITRAVFGPFLLIIALDYYVNTNLKYIIITIIRRITVPEFRSAFVYPPAQDEGTFCVILSCKCKSYAIDINDIHPAFRPDFNMHLDCTDTITIP